MHHCGLAERFFVGMTIAFYHVHGFGVGGSSLITTHGVISSNLPRFHHHHGIPFGRAFMPFEKTSPIIRHHYLAAVQVLDDEDDSDDDDVSLSDVKRRQIFHKVASTTFGVSSAIIASFSSYNRAYALSPEEASRDYNSYASNYDQLDGGDASSMLGIPKARAKLMSRARGHVLEIGAGTGLNLEYYLHHHNNNNNREQSSNNNIISSLTLVDISDGMLQQAKQRIQALSPVLDFPVTCVQADATRDLVALFGSSQTLLFDTVVDTFSLCVMGNEGAQQCLRQLRDVMKDSHHGGQMLLLENSKSSQPLLAWYQDLTAESAASMGGKGCVYNQDVRAMIQSTGGLVIESEEAYATGLFRAFVCTKQDLL